MASGPTPHEREKRTVMTSPRFRSRRFRAPRPALLFAVVLLLGGCQSLNIKAPSFAFDKAPEYVDLAPAPLPSYRAGDSFTYRDDKGVERLRSVVRVAGDRVDWTTEEGYRFTSSHNFALPPLAWDGPSSTGEMLGRPDPSFLWPLREGNRADITVRYRKRYKTRTETKEYEEHWFCQVNRPRVVTVPAGAFDAYEVVCKRLNADKRVTRTHIWYYAPKVGHFIKRIKKYRSKPDKTIELVASRRAGAG